jgi:hypothetical protein
MNGLVPLLILSISTAPAIVISFDRWERTLSCLGRPEKSTARITRSARSARRLHGGVDDVEVMWR